jgi:alanine-glyoxylate transaminase/serine-glyoxylate transaminase/serine-pyruvate transaminase
MKIHKLMIPGPVDILDDVRETMASPSVPHYGQEWLAIYRETVELLRQVFQTRNDLFLLAGPGSAGLDAALGSLLRTGEKVLALVNGFFGSRLADIARCYGLEVMLLEFPAGQPVDLDAVRACLSAERDVQAVAMVHHETSTGVLNPLQEVATLAHGRGLPIIVDAIASLGGVPVPVDEWELDMVVTVANKCLETPPAVTPISVSERAWKLVDSKPGRHHGWYLNLDTWREYNRSWADWHPYPTTLPTHNIMALRASLKRILANGIENHYAKHVRAAGRVRAGLREMGFELFVAGEHACPLITSVRARPEFEADDLARFLRDEHDILIGGGIADLRGKIFRVGHMGRAASDEYVEAFRFAVKDFLGRAGLA